MFQTNRQSAFIEIHIDEMQLCGELPFVAARAHIDHRLPQSHHRHNMSNFATPRLVEGGVIPSHDNDERIYRKVPTFRDSKLLSTRAKIIHEYIYMRRMINISTDWIAL